MSTEFSLRSLCREVWDELGDCDSVILAEQLARRIPPRHRAAVFEETLAVYTSLFIGGQRRADAKAPLRDRFERRTRRVGDCLVWTGKVTSNGYGAITISDHGHREVLPVHRVSYAEFVGPIPDGYDIDHTCHSSNPEACPGRPNCLHILCWNPEHLRPATRLENVRGRKSWSGRKTHCPRGHEYTPGNTYSPPSNPSARVCRMCRYLRDQQRYALQRAT